MIILFMIIIIIFLIQTPLLENFMMESNTGISVPALCSKRTNEYCMTTPGCVWNKNKCELNAH